MKNTGLFVLMEPNYVQQQNRAPYVNNRSDVNKTADQLRLKELN
jgi:hypothetical protein